MNNLHNKTALVTGGGSGIGRAIVEELAAQGARVFIHYHSSAQAAEELAADIKSRGGEAHTGGADLTEAEEVAALLTKVETAFGGLDVLVNNAGDLVARKSLEEMDLEFFRRVAAINLDSALQVTRYAVPLLRDRGGASVVNLSSLAGRKGGHAGSLAYATAKGGLLTMTRALALELAPLGIRVNAVAPGLILGSRFHSVHTSEESKQATIREIPLGRAGLCEDVARAVAFLAGETGGFITGATLDINGGVYSA
jgi:3-oxoacyl-[acyl-carrier protein] reductase